MYTIQQVAKELNCSVSGVRKWIKEGSIKAIALPTNGTDKSYRIAESELKRLKGETEAEAGE